MAHRVRQRKFSRTTNQRKALLKNLANDLILQERITTTTAKAKEVRPFVEKLVTKSKTDDLNTRRQLLAKLGRENTVNKLLELVGPLFKERPGGYTRILKIQARTGDQAKMAIIEFVENISEKAAQEKISKKEVKSKKEGEKDKPKDPKLAKAKTLKPKAAAKTKETKPSTKKKEK